MDKKWNPRCLRDPHCDHKSEVKRPCANCICYLDFQQHIWLRYEEEMGARSEDLPFLGFEDWKNEEG